MFPYNSPKNPIGVMPFQPKGERSRKGEKSLPNGEKSLPNERSLFK
jgi:hypothetical protein